MSFETTHKLDFEVAPWEPIPGFMNNTENFYRFRVGTCHGLWRSTWISYDILAIDNEEKGNGHFEDVLEWFEQSCRRDKKCLRILEVMNKRFKTHLIEKRGFVDIKLDNVQKLFQ